MKSCNMRVIQRMRKKEFSIAVKSTKSVGSAVRARVNAALRRKAEGGRTVDRLDDEEHIAGEGQGGGGAVDADGIILRPKVRF